MSEALKTVAIKGKPYVLVNERIKAFRKNYAGWSLETEIVELSRERCTIRAVIRDQEGTIKATGTAYEEADSTYINKTSYVENCETSAWGRALGNLGIGIDTSIASAEEMQNAINNQQGELPFPEAGETISKNNVEQLKGILAVFPDANRKIALKAVYSKYKVKSLSELNTGQYVKVRDELLHEGASYVKARLNSAAKTFANNTNIGEEEARQYIEEVIGKPIDDVMVAEFPKVKAKIAPLFEEQSHE